MVKSLWSLLVVVSIVVMSVDPPKAEGAISCSTVVTDLMPCLNYLMYSGAPSVDCCNGARAIYNQARDTPDRQAVCSCLKSVASSSTVTPPMISNANGLPGKCGIDVPYQISPNIDCSRIQ